MTYNTNKRERIIAFMRSNADAAYTVDDICANILDGGRGKSTVYRIISELLNEGVLKRISSGNTRHTTYQYMKSTCQSHLHLKCTRCGELIHLGEHTSKIIMRRIFGENSFSVDSASFLYGTCQKCTQREVTV